MQVVYKSGMFSEVGTNPLTRQFPDFGVPPSANFRITDIYKEETPMNGYTLYECAIVFVPKEGRPEFWGTSHILAKSAEDARVQAVMEQAGGLEEASEGREVKVLVRPFRG